MIAGHQRERLPTTIWHLSLTLKKIHKSSIVVIVLCSSQVEWSSKPYPESWILYNTQNPAKNSSGTLNFILLMLMFEILYC